MQPVLGRRARDRWHRRRARSSSPRLRGAIMPASSTSAPPALSVVMILSRLALARPGSSPRSASLAPSSRITASVRSGTAQSQALQPACRRIARNAGIDHLHRMAARLQGALQLGGKGVRRLEPEARHQAVAEHDDAHRARRRLAGVPAAKRARQSANCRGERETPCLRASRSMALCASDAFPVRRASRLRDSS